MNSSPSENPLLRTSERKPASRRADSVPPSVWMLRAVLIGVPLTVGSATAAALGDHSDSLRYMAVALVWLVWVAMVLAAFVPRPMGLTGLRLGLPALTAAAAFAALGGAGATLGGLGLAFALGSLVVALLPTTIDHFVDGVSYGNERRFALRIPLPLLIAPLPIAIALAIAGAVAGPLLLADMRWVAGVAALIVGWPAAAVLTRSVHALANRWLVFVPAGLTIVDSSALATPVHLPRGSIARFGPASVDSDAIDLTNRSTGLILEVALDPEVNLETRVGRSNTEGASAHAVLVSPLRPGAVLDEARERRIAVG